MKIGRFSIAQMNFTVGDISKNLEKIKDGIEEAIRQKSDVVLFPELALSGYPPEDLVFRPQFIESNLEALNALTLFTQGKDILVVAGFIDKKEDQIYNAAAVIYNGVLADIYHKIFLPNYGVFDEKRYFTSGKTIPVYLYKQMRIGVNICEDIWYPVGPLHYQTLLGNAEIIVNISASPYHAGKQNYRETMFSTRAGDESVFLINCNLVGGQDELVFDGSSTVFNEEGVLIARMKSFEEDFSTFDLDGDSVFRRRLKDIRRKQEKELTSSSVELPFKIQIIDISKNMPRKNKLSSIEKPPVVLATKSNIASIYHALVLGTKDYAEKNGFEKVIIALSGGIDSALVAAIAVDALGAEKVKGIYMPSAYSAEISGEDARNLSQNMGVELFEIPIIPLFEKFQNSLEGIFKGLPFGIAEENLQSRIRGNIVMALSNKFGYLVLATGNKSEMSTGYATLYGDMAGGFAVIKDVLKTTVYDLVHYRNSISPVIPQRIIDRPPSAELRPDQKDTDSLPEYSILDKIIRYYVEEDKTFEEIDSEIKNTDLVKRVIRLINMSEYKRRQAPPGIKITPRAFGKDRRMPITNGYGN
jgi:NAD+ synthase (glutamine-hydrolysing)